MWLAAFSAEARSYIDHLKSVHAGREKELQRQLQASAQTQAARASSASSGSLDRSSAEGAGAGSGASSRSHSHSRQGSLSLMDLSEDGSGSGSGSMGVLELMQAVVCQRLQAHEAMSRLATAQQQLAQQLDSKEVELAERNREYSNLLHKGEVTSDELCELRRMQTQTEVSSRIHLFA